MNERIKELAERSKDWKRGNGMDYLAVDLEKFAELIIRECLSYMNDADGDIDYVKFMINRNFGVEE